MRRKINLKNLPESKAKTKFWLESMRFETLKPEGQKRN